MISDNYDAVPQELKDRNIWLPFRIFPRPSGGFDKVPHDARGYKADYTNPDVWMTFAKALDMAIHGKYAGIGFTILEAMGYVLIDFDHCAHAGELKPSVADWIQKLNTYSEWSYSGTGVHVIARGELLYYGNKPKAGGKEIEMYSGKRFFTVSGRHLDSTPHTVETRQEVIDAIHRDHFGERGKRTPGALASCGSAVTVNSGEHCIVAAGEARSSRFSDEVVIRELCQHPTYNKYWNGWHGRADDRSAADFALGCRLAWLTGGDMPQMRRLMMKSVLNRPKYHERRGQTDYLGYTLDQCVLKTQGCWDGSKNTLPPSSVNYGSIIAGPVASASQTTLSHHSLNDLQGSSPAENMENVLNKNTDLETERAPLLNKKWTRRRAQRGAVISSLSSHKGWVKLPTIESESQLAGRAAYHQLSRLIGQGLVERRGQSYRMVRNRKQRSLQPCADKPIPLWPGTTHQKSKITRTELVQRGWPAQMIDRRLTEEGRHWTSVPVTTRDHGQVIARCYLVQYIVEAERDPGFELERRRILQQPLDNVKNLVVKFLEDSKGWPQRSYHIAQRIGASRSVLSRAIKALIKEGVLVVDFEGKTRVYQLAAQSSASRLLAA